MSGIASRDLCVDATLSAYHGVHCFFLALIDGRVRFNIPQVKDTQDNSS